MKKIFKLFLHNLLALFLIVTITFFLIRIIPGDPFLLDIESDNQIIRNLIEKYGFDKPLIYQYFKYIKNLAHFNLGVSIKIPDVKVSDIILEHFPISLYIGLCSLILSFIIGSILAIFSNKLNSIVNILGVSIPSFIIAFCLQILVININKKFGFSFKIHGFNSIYSIILPVISLSVLNTARISKLLSQNLKIEYSKDYVLLAKSKGLTDNQIKLKHCLRNAIMPVISSLGVTIASTLTGSFIIESMFGIPGIGKYYIESIQSRDYSLTLGLTIFFAFFLILVFFIIDLITLFINPNTRKEDLK